MLRLLSISDDEWSLGKFQNKAANIEDFLSRNNLQGLELMRWQSPQAEAVPMNMVIGRHMPFWPTWLDFWRDNQENLLRQFGDMEHCREYYCAGSREEFIQSRRNELLDAARMGVKYVVFHVSHVELEHCYTGCFAYSDEEVVEEYIQMINEILEGVPNSFSILFENHWYPGFKLLDRNLAMKLLENVQYTKKGFVLDISHMMNTNGNLKSEGDAVLYILKMLDALGEMKKHIKTIHLNSSIGKRPPVEHAAFKFDSQANYEDKLINAMKYVSGLDPHCPFTDPVIQKVIDAVQPEYLVYELAAHSLDELQEAVGLQNKCVDSAF